MKSIKEIDKKFGKLLMIFWGLIALVASIFGFIFGIWVLLNGHWQGVLILLAGFMFLFLSITSFRQKAPLSEIINRSWGRNK